jgi:hypothetical protein
MKRVMRSVYAGAVCEKIVFSVADNTTDIKHAKPKPRFKTDEERRKHSREIARRHHALLFNENMKAGESLYSTLTFDDENEIYTFSEAAKIRDIYIRRLRRKYPDAKIFLYYGRGKTTARIHFHMVSLGIPEEFIKQKWTFGGTGKIVPLRKQATYNGEICEMDFTPLANYLFEHFDESERSGHRYYKTRNMTEPQKERTNIILREYSEAKPPRAPKGYVLVECRSNEFGYLYFKYIRKIEKSKRE